MNENKFSIEEIKQEIEYYFKFLFDRGFRFRPTNFFHPTALGWSIWLESVDCLIKINSDRYAIYLGVAPTSDESPFSIRIEAIIYFLSKGEKLVEEYEGNYLAERSQQFQRLANLLSEYMDQILPIFAVDYERHKQDLESALMKVNKLYEERFYEKHKDHIDKVASDIRRSMPVRGTKRRDS